MTSVPFFQVYGLLDTLVTDLMILADELSPMKNVGELFLCEPDPCARAAFCETG